MVTTPEIPARVDTTASIFCNLYDTYEEAPLIRYDGGLHILYGPIYIKLIDKRNRVFFALMHDGVQLDLTWKGEWKLTSTYTENEFNTYLSSVTYLNSFWEKVAQM